MSCNFADLSIIICLDFSFGEVNLYITGVDSSTMDVSKFPIADDIGTSIALRCNSTNDTTLITGDNSTIIH